MTENVFGTHVAAVGISNLQFVDMNSPRNIFIVGDSTVLASPKKKFVEANPDAIRTGKWLSMLNPPLAGSSNYLHALPFSVKFILLK